MKHLILFENFEEETNESTSATGGLSVSTGVSGGPASGLGGQTLSTNWVSSTNKVSDGTLDVAYNPGGSNRVFQKIPAPMGFNHGSMTGKKSREKKLDLKTLRAAFNKRKEDSVTSPSGDRKVMSFDNFEKDNINKVKKLSESRFTDEYDFSDHNFNCGDCDIYAIALHRVYGYPLYIVNGYHKEEDWDEEAGYTEYDSEPAHIVVKLPNGNYMDSDGEVTEEELKRDCAFGNKIEYIKIEPITEQEAMYVYSGEDQEEDIERITKYIKSKK